ncbi:NPCBM/NEW2 domain-containing protein [Streptosporangium soli]
MGPAWSVGSQKVNGKTYERSLSLRSCYSESYVGYDLNRQHKEFGTLIGLSDSAPSGYSIRFQAFLDGKRLVQHDLGVGHTKKLKLDVTGGLRLLLRAQLLSPCLNSTNGVAVWADAWISK